MGDLASRQLHNKSSVFLVELLLSQRKLIITAALAFCWKHRDLRAAYTFASAKIK